MCLPGSVRDTVTLGLVICERVLHNRPEARLAGRNRTIAEPVHAILQNELPRSVRRC